MRNRVTLITIVVAFLLGMGLMFFIKGKQIKEVKVPFKVEVPVPVVEHKFDSIPYPVPVYKTETVVDSSLVDEYKKANDSLKQKLFEQAVEINDYVEVFEDSIQTITVKAQTTGVLNLLKASYKTKPRTIAVDTTLTVEVPDYSRALVLYTEVGVPIETKIDEVNPMILKAGIDYSNKKNWIFGVSYDTNKTGWIKIGKKFNF